MPSCSTEIVGDANQLRMHLLRACLLSESIEASNQRRKIEELSMKVVELEAKLKAAHCQSKKALMMTKKILSVLKRYEVGESSLKQECSGGSVSWRRSTASYLSDEKMSKASNIHHRRIRGHCLMRWRGRESGGKGEGAVEGFSVDIIGEKGEGEEGCSGRSDSDMRVKNVGDAVDVNDDQAGAGVSSVHHNQVGVRSDSVNGGQQSEAVDPVMSASPVGTEEVGCDVVKRVESVEEDQGRGHEEGDDGVSLQKFFPMPPRYSRIFHLPLCRQARVITTDPSLLTQSKISNVSSEP